MIHRLKWAFYGWVDRRGQIPRWAFWLWPRAHWCPEMDDLLVLWNTEDCFCGHCPRPPADSPEWRKVNGEIDPYGLGWSPADDDEWEQD